MVTRNIADNKNIAHIIVPDLDISLTPLTLNNEAERTEDSAFLRDLSVPAVGLMCLWAKPLCWDVTMLPLGSHGALRGQWDIVVCGKPVALPWHVSAPRHFGTMWLFIITGHRALRL